MLTRCSLLISVNSIVWIPVAVPCLWKKIDSMRNWRLAKFVFFSQIIEVSVELHTHSVGIILSLCDYGQMNAWSSLWLSWLPVHKYWRKEINTLIVILHANFCSFFNLILLIYIFNDMLRAPTCLDRPCALKWDHNNKPLLSSFRWHSHAADQPEPLGAPWDLKSSLCALLSSSPLPFPTFFVSIFKQFGFHFSPQTWCSSDVLHRPLNLFNFLPRRKST